MPKRGLPGWVPWSLNCNGARLSWLKMLSCLFFANLRSVCQKRGPRKELRPMPGNHRLVYHNYRTTALASVLTAKYAAGEKKFWHIICHWSLVVPGSICRCNRIDHANVAEPGRPGGTPPIRLTR
jgi:hypothetical protein